MKSRPLQKPYSSQSSLAASKHTKWLNANEITHFPPIPVKCGQTPPRLEHTTKCSTFKQAWIRRLSFCYCLSHRVRGHCRVLYVVKWAASLFKFRLWWVTALLYRCLLRPLRPVRAIPLRSSCVWIRRKLSIGCCCQEPHCAKVFVVGNRSS